MFVLCFTSSLLLYVVHASVKYTLPVLKFWRIWQKKVIKMTHNLWISPILVCIWWNWLSIIYCRWFCGQWGPHWACQGYARGHRGAPACLVRFLLCLDVHPGWSCVCPEPCEPWRTCLSLGAHAWALAHLPEPWHTCLSLGTPAWIHASMPLQVWCTGLYVVIQDYHTKINMINSLSVMLWCQIRYMYMYIKMHISWFITSFIPKVIYLTFLRHINKQRAVWLPLEMEYHIIPDRFRVNMLIVKILCITPNMSPQQIKIHVTNFASSVMNRKRG